MLDTYIKLFVVNDKHSGLNSTNMREVLRPQNIAQLQQIVCRAASCKQSISIAGGRHAMGGQQFLSDGILVDTSDLNNVLDFDQSNGLVRVESGIQWPALIEFLQARDVDNGSERWSIIQKQTGCDSLSMGGALSANIHGRGLCKPPIIDDVQSFEIITADGSLKYCSRAQNRELFQLAIGGYGLFGLIASVTLRLARRQRLIRSVEKVSSSEAVSLLERKEREGAIYGDFQFDIDDGSEDFLQSGILSTYAPLSDQSCVAKVNRALSVEDWRELVYLAHADKKTAFSKYLSHYLASDGQIYWSDSLQLSTYVDDYHQDVDARTSASCRGSEMITELYVPRGLLPHFLAAAAKLLRETSADVIYGTVRLIESDNESFLTWASQSWACVVLNLHVEHSQDGLNAAANSFRRLIDLAITFGGSYYLTYHRFAAPEQLKRCYPQIFAFLDLKQKYDPDNLFVSDWFHHTKWLVDHQGTTLK